jgi:hypothetical protein
MYSKHTIIIYSHPSMQSITHQSFLFLHNCNLGPISKPFPPQFHSPWPLVNTILLTSSMRSTFLNPTYAWGHVILVFLCWLISLNIVISSSDHVASNVRIPFLFMAEHDSVVNLYHILEMHLSDDWHMGCFRSCPYSVLLLVTEEHSLGSITSWCL